MRLSEFLEKAHDPVVDLLGERLAHQFIHANRGCRPPFGQGVGRGLVDDQPVLGHGFEGLFIQVQCLLVQTLGDPADGFEHRLAEGFGDAVPGPVRQDQTADDRRQPNVQHMGRQGEKLA